MNTLIADLKTRGFYEFHTGGNFIALRLDLPEDCFLLVTDTDCGLPVFEEPMQVGWYAPDSTEAEDWAEGDLDAVMTVINKYWSN